MVFLQKKTCVQYKLDSSSKTQFAFLYPKDIQKIFWKTINFAENLDMTKIAGGAEGGSCYLRHYDAMRTKIDVWFTPCQHILKKT